MLVLFFFLSPGSVLLCGCLVNLSRLLQRFELHSCFPVCSCCLWPTVPEKLKTPYQIHCQKPLTPVEQPWTKWLEKRFVPYERQLPDEAILLCIVTKRSSVLSSSWSDRVFFFLEKTTNKAGNLAGGGTFNYTDTLSPWAGWSTLFFYF